MKINVPPLKCQGIKTKLVEWICSTLPQEREGIWYEPFMGSGVVGFNVYNRHSIMADVNPHIIHFYNDIQNKNIDSNIVRTFLEQEGLSLSKQGQAHYNAIRSRFNNNHNSLDFLFLNRAGFNGLMRWNRNGNFNVPFGHKPYRFSKSYITKIVNQIHYISDITNAYHFEFIHSDFRDVLSKAMAQDIIYCDPPYNGKHTDYFSGWSERDEQELFELLCATKAKFILSTWYGNDYRKNPNIQKYETRFNIKTREHFYHVGAKETNRKPVYEALVMNY